MSFHNNPNVGNPVPDQDEELPDNLDLVGQDEDESNMEDAEEEVETSPDAGYFTRYKAKVK